ncbi:MAG: preprotein translocase subunit YajC [Deltaproteobacteria bacterium]|nr:preprotein translocase subunit YajC [Deltaproteobacteria bacterium]MBW1922893.1 preprotein translocase subunit YajC [Deltaproteobacteria bacterium]MBW1948890.1 preprotein translocase subunit YajC [Deltaproteobacteria bacterium]MBW2008029.1 preprotein translocase subunit YajC [Deltaproteobacteria bacterium]MBW2101809.1 preprotein translocase subunit YajC [Deltaproteobacteria bacterium]
MNFLAYAMGGGSGGAGGQGGGFGAFIPLILMFAIFYFLLIRPQQKKAKQHKEMISAIKKGDRVVSSGGLHGTVTGVTDEVVTMEIAPKVRVKVSRGSIAGVTRKDTPSGPNG